MKVWRMYNSTINTSGACSVLFYSPNLVWLLHYTIRYSSLVFSFSSSSFYTVGICYIARKKKDWVRRIHHIHSFKCLAPFIVPFFCRNTSPTVYRLFLIIFPLLGEILYKYMYMLRIHLYMDVIQMQRPYIQQPNVAQRNYYSR